MFFKMVKGDLSMREPMGFYDDMSIDEVSSVEDLL